MCTQISRPESHALFVGRRGGQSFLSCSTPSGPAFWIAFGRQGRHLGRPFGKNPELTGVFVVQSSD